MFLFCVKITKSKQKIFEIKLCLISAMDYCRLCAKNDKKPLIPILTDNPLKIREKIEKFFKLKVKNNARI